MDLSSHCNLCENHGARRDGLYCKLTDRKPQFVNKCTSIQFGREFEKRLKRQVSVLRTRQAQMPKIWFIGLTLGIAGITVFLISIYAAFVFANVGGHSFVTISTFTTIATGVGPIILNVRKLKYEKADLARTEKLAAHYGIRYQYDVHFERNYAGKKIAKVSFKWINQRPH